MQKLPVARFMGDLAFFAGGALHPGRRLVDGRLLPGVEPGWHLVGVSPALLVLELAFSWFHPRGCLVDGRPEKSFLVSLWLAAGPSSRPRPGLAWLASGSSHF